MKAKHIAGAKLEITVESRKGEKSLHTIRVKDNRTGRDWTEAQIEARGVQVFADIDDAKEALNWTLNGSPKKYRLIWAPSTKAGSVGVAYIFD